MCALLVKAVQGDGLSNEGLVPTKEKASLGEMNCQSCIVTEPSEHALTQHELLVSSSISTCTISLKPLPIVLPQVSSGIHGYGI